MAAAVAVGGIVSEAAPAVASCAGPVPSCLSWLRAKLRTPCICCGLDITPGDRIVPQEFEGHGLRYAHLSCHKTAAALDRGRGKKDALICKHWRTRGYCLYGESCVYRHPAECLESLAQQHAQLAARKAAAASTNCARVSARASPAAQRPGQRRKEPRNKFRASAFRRFLLDTFGRELLRRGTGVLDVAGGRGELAFELLNLNHTPATVVEPRPLDLERRIKWLLAGFYHWNAAFARYNDRQWISSAVEQGRVPQPQQRAKQRQDEQAEGGEQQQQHVAAGTAPLLPDHLRLVVTPDLAACLTSAAGSSSSGSRRTIRASSSGGSAEIGAITAQQQEGGAEGEQGDEAAAAAEEAGAAPPEWSAVFEEACRAARRGKWLKAAPAHEGGIEPGAAGSDAEETASSNGSSSVAGRSQGSSGSSSPEPAVTPLPAQTPRRPAVAWSIPAADTESEDEHDDDDEGCCCGGSWRDGSDGGSTQDRQAPEPHQQRAEQQQLLLHKINEQQTCPARQEGPEQVPAPVGAPATANAAAPACRPPQHPQQEQPQGRRRADATGLATAAALAQAGPCEVGEAGAAWARFTQCSVVCGMHPDQATEFIVDLALALGKPFAVVPCCVYSCDFPRRQLDGRPVTRYEQFLQYLQAKDPEGRIRVARLPFEGRNKVLYRLP